MLTHLTEEQKSFMKPLAEKWIKIGLSTEPADRKTFEENVQKCYKFAGLNPAPVFWVDDPLTLALSTSISDRIINNVLRKSNSPLKSSAVGSAVDSAVDSAVRSAVCSAVDTAV